MWAASVEAVAERRNWAALMSVVRACRLGRAIAGGCGGGAIVAGRLMRVELVRVRRGCGLRWNVRLGILQLCRIKTVIDSLGMGKQRI